MSLSTGRLCYKVSKSFGTMSACVPPFSLHGFPTFVGHISSFRCARNFEIVKLNFFFLPFCLVELLRICVRGCSGEGKGLFGGAIEIFRDGCCRLPPGFTYIL